MNLYKQQNGHTPHIYSPYNYIYSQYHQQALYDDNIALQQALKNSIETCPRDIILSRNYNATLEAQKRVSFPRELESKSKKRKANNIDDEGDHDSMHKKPKLQEVYSLQCLCAMVLAKYIEKCYVSVLSFDPSCIKLPKCLILASTSHLLNKYDILESDLAVTYFRSYNIEPGYCVSFLKERFTPYPVLYSWTTIKSFLIILNNVYSVKNTIPAEVKNMAIYNDVFSADNIVDVLNYVYGYELEYLKPLAISVCLSYFGAVFDTQSFITLPDDIKDIIEKLHFNYISNI